MKNLFSLTTYPLFHKIHQIPLDNTTARDKMIKGVWDEFVENSILHIQKDEKSALENTKSITEIADICVEISKPLFLGTINNYDSLLQEAQNSDNENTFDFLEQVYPSFQNSKCFSWSKGKFVPPPNLNDEFFSNVKEYLILSFIYNQSCNFHFLKPCLLDVQSIFPYLCSADKKTSILPGKLGNIQKCHDKFRKYIHDNAKRVHYNIDKYLEFLIEYQQEEKEDNEKKKSRKKRISHKLSSWYDIPIFAGLVSSCSPTKNPYFYSDDRPCKLDIFLDGFNPFNMCKPLPSLSEMPIYLVKSLKAYYSNKLNTKTSKILSANIACWNFLIPYLMERVTNINLINNLLNSVSCYPRQLQSEFIYQLSAYPLLSYRQSIIGRYPVWNNGIPNEENDRKLELLLNQHLFVAFPQIDLLFNLALLLSGCYFEPINISECSKLLYKVCSLFKIERTASLPDMSSSFSFKPCERMSYESVDNTIIKKIIDAVFDYFGDYAIWGETIPRLLQSNYPTNNIRKHAGIVLGKHIASQIHLQKEGMLDSNEKIYGGFYFVE